MLEAAAVHPGRSARGHLLALAAANAISRRRVDEVLALAGLEGVAVRRAGGFSLGMLQRLSPWTGFAVFCAYTAAVLTAAALTLNRRDA